MKKRLIALMLCLVMSVSVAETAFADRKSDLQNSVAQDQNQLSDTNQKIQENQQANDAVQANISELDAQLLNLMTNIEVIKNDITSTEGQIEEAEANLAEAEADKEQQYQDMGQRIRYLYEKRNGLGIIAYILESQDLSEFLNRIAYANEMYKYDREKLQKYEATVANIQTMKTELEGIQASLQDEETSLEEQQASLDEALKEKKAQSENYEAEIAALQEQAQALTQEIASQNAELEEIRQAEIEAARKAAEEAARKAAEEEAARKAAEEEERKKAEAEAAEAAAAAAAAAASNASSNNAQVGNDEQAGTVSGSSSSQPAASTPAPTEAPASSSSGVTGQQIANYACQFIGNPYVAGGCSLTNGADCAGFVYAVYKHFGYIMERNPDWMSTRYGRQISVSELKPGDIVGYYGHVGIYIGNNTIVHASCPSVGITTTSPITYRSIRACTRIFDY